MPAPIIERIKIADNLPSLPTVAMQLVQMSRNSQASATDIAQILQQDPALTAKVLQMVNSAMYGMTRKISSLNQAVVVLGQRAVKVLALSFSLVDTIHQAKSDQLDYQAFWRRSLTTAVAARLLSRAVAPRQSEESFISGLLADIGIVAAFACAREMYQPVYACHISERQPLAQIESAQLGVTHAAMSQAMLRTWNLPEDLCVAVGAHHGEGLEALSGPQSELARIVFVGSAIATLCCQDAQATPRPEVTAQCLELLAIDDATLDRVLEELDTHVKDTASMMSVEVGKTTNYAQIQVDAAMRLAQLSMEAEVERAHFARREENTRLQLGLVQLEKQVIMEDATIDGLTGIENRAAFDKHLVEKLDSTSRGGLPLGLILLDVDHFKQFNDTHGHQAGDEVLRRVGATLQEVAREHGFIARYGGEEFAAIVAGQTANALARLAEDIRMAIQLLQVDYNGSQLRVTASLGVANADPKTVPQTPEEMIEMADQNLYRAKKNGRNRVEVSAAALEQPQTPDASN